MSENYISSAKEIDAGVSRLLDGVPGPMRAYSQLVTEASKPGTIDARTKELMAIAISIAIGCDGCIAYHTRAAYKKGANRDEVLETIGVAVEMGGGPAVVYGAKVLEAYDQNTGAGA